MALTKRQKEILDFLRDFLNERGYSPSFEEIADRFGYSSLATVHTGPIYWKPTSPNWPQLQATST
jgi:SOS-response transcriptional repressor LexA